MKASFTLILVLVIILIVLSFYFGWFGVSMHNTGNTSQVTMTVNQAKIRNDKNKVVQDIQNLKSASTKPESKTSGNTASTQPSTENQANK